MTQDFNVYEMWKDFQQKSSTYIDEKMNEEFPSQGMGHFLEMNLLFKKMLHETSERYFEQVNIPTRNDLSNIASLIINVDSKVDDLEDLIEETKANQANQAELQRDMTDLKKEMKNLDTKLNQILTQLKSPKAATPKKRAVKKQQNN